MNGYDKYGSTKGLHIVFDEKPCVHCCKKVMDMHSSKRARSRDRSVYSTGEGTREDQSSGPLLGFASMSELNGVDIAIDVSRTYANIALRVLSSDGNFCLTGKDIQKNMRQTIESTFKEAEVETTNQVHLF